MDLAQHGISAFESLHSVAFVRCCQATSQNTTGLFFNNTGSFEIDFFWIFAWYDGAMAGYHRYRHVYKHAYRVVAGFRTFVP